MKIAKIACDNCQKEVVNVAEEIGWVVLGSHSIEIYAGANPRNSLGGPVLLFHVHSPGGRFDFCCIACLTKYLTKQAANGQRRLTVQRNKKEKAKK